MLTGADDAIKLEGDLVLMKKVDRRIARTRKALAEAIVHLTLTVGYDRVTIKDIAKYAKISYATFFRHFKSKDEVMEYAFAEAFDETMEAVASATTYYDEALAVYKHIRKNRSVFLVAFALPRGNKTVDTWYNQLAKFFLERLGAKDEGVIPLDVSVNHLVQSTTGLIHWYLENDERYSPEEMAAIHRELIVKVVKHVAVDYRTPLNEHLSTDH